MTKLMPSSKWKLVVDVGTAPPPPAAERTAENHDQPKARNFRKQSCEDLLASTHVELLAELIPIDDGQLVRPEKIIHVVLVVRSSEGMRAKP